MKTENTYDSLGRLVETRRHGSEVYKAGGNRTIYHFAGDSPAIEYTEYYSQWNENGTHNAPVYDYQEISPDGLSRVTKIYNENRVLTRITDDEFNNDGRIILEITAFPDETVDFYNTFEYDGAGKRTGNLRFDVNGQGKTIRDIVLEVLGR